MFVILKNITIYGYFFLFFFSSSSLLGWYSSGMVLKAGVDQCYLEGYPKRKIWNETLILWLLINFWLIFYWTMNQTENTRMYDHHQPWTTPTTPITHNKIPLEIRISLKFIFIFNGKMAISHFFFFVWHFDVTLTNLNNNLNYNATQYTSWTTLKQ